MSNPKLGPFVGLNNRAPAHQLAVVERGRKVGDFVRNAVNVDLTAAGTLQRRPGTTREVVGTEAHSLWGDGIVGYYVDGENLKRFPDTVLRGGLTPGLRVSFAKDALGGIVWSNGVEIERIVGTTSLPLIPQTPNPEPTVTVAAGGALSAGAYQVAVVAVEAGVESAPTWPVQVVVPEGGRINVSGLAGTVRVYASACDGDVLFLNEETSSASTSIAVPPLTDSPQLTTVGLRPLPPGHIVRTFRGRTLVANGSTLYMSEPYALGLYNPLRGFIPLPARITVCEPCDDGVYLCADQTYWLGGKNVVDSELLSVLPYGGVEGTGGARPEEKSVFWYSPRGAIVGRPSGQVKAVQEDAVAVDAAVAGAMAYREQNGLRQLVASVFGTQPSVAVATSFAEAEVIRKESML